MKEKTKYVVGIYCQIYPRKGSAGHQPRCPAEKSKYVRYRCFAEERIHGITNGIPK